ncbi:uncharacterized protein LOC122024611 [Zingiber officinale]|uniref:uncharacterized protein LOC122024611 n=1 Tax=Zingiber officinale TaxID=94328 RepID=UPI001C4AFBD2|nr:uncharacterized protein LOC122024611 [Zingiber officinale]
MWGEGGRFYWGRSEGEGRREAKGIAVLFSWLSSQESDLKPFLDLYWSLGWSPLVCHVDFLTLYYPDKVTSLAHGVLDELVKVIKIKQLPIVFVCFSLGSKGCMDRILQVLDGKWQGGHIPDEYRLIRDCVCGQIHDSGPVDFTNESVARFIHHPSAQRLFRLTRITSWAARAMTSGLGNIFASRLEAQRVEYWKTLYSSASMGAFLIFCSEDDELASYQTIVNFGQRLKELGGDVKLVKWSNSPHIGHYKHHRNEYLCNVVELLDKAAATFSQRCINNGAAADLGSACNSILESICSLREAALTSTECLRKVIVEPNDHFTLPSPNDNFETKNGSSSSNDQTGNSFTQPSINPQGVLSQILFDSCVPKNVEGWDIKPSISSKGKKQCFGSGHLNRGPMNPMRYIRRSRL